jgi:hypothetical protein
MLRDDIMRTMPLHLENGALLLVILAVGAAEMGCESSQRAGGPSVCQLRTPALPAADAGAGDPVRATVEAKRLAELDLLVGRYLRGDAAVYLGTLSAHDNQSVFGDPSTPLWLDQSIPPGEALASLAVDDVQATLAVVGSSQGKGIVFRQARDSPMVTETSIILDSRTSGGPSASCTDCAPSFLDRPAAIAWADLDASYTGAEPIAPYHVVSTVNLRLESPCSVTWEQLVALDVKVTTENSPSGGLSGFAQVGEEMVWHASGAVQTVPPQPHNCVGQSVPYTIDLYVSRANLAVYGVRNFSAGPVQPVCGP